MKQFSDVKQSKEKIEKIKEKFEDMEVKSFAREVVEFR